MIKRDFLFISCLIYCFKVRNELATCSQECQIINEKLNMQKACRQVLTCILLWFHGRGHFCLLTFLSFMYSAEKSLEVEQLKNDIVLLNEQKKISENVSFFQHNDKNSNGQIVNNGVCLQKLQNQIVEMTKKRDEILDLVKELKSCVQRH